MANGIQLCKILFLLLCYNYIRYKIGLCVCLWNVYVTIIDALFFFHSIYIYIFYVYDGLY